METPLAQQIELQNFTDAKHKHIIYDYRSLDLIKKFTFNRQCTN